jgi:hypothetical protein
MEELTSMMDKTDVFLLNLLIMDHTWYLDNEWIIQTQTTQKLIENN